jgi:hypothetical protein
VKSLAVGIALSLLIAVVAFLPGAPDQGEGNSFSGEIMDAQCGQAGSHDQKMKEHDFTTTLQCALFCARVQTPGGRFVLYDKARKTVYRLDDQARAELYVTAKVTITGTVDAATKTIRIADIEATP